MSDWYSKATAADPLNQGDMIRDCPALIPSDTCTLDSGKAEVSVVRYNVVVLSQSCDLVAGKLQQVQVAPYWSLDELAEHQAYLKCESGKESLRRGYIPGLHLLNKCQFDNDPDKFLVVEFPNSFSVPLSLLKRFVEHQVSRIRIESPYREHLSQAYARFFMRVGLPIDIPQFSRTPDVGVS